MKNWLDLQASMMVGVLNVYNSFSRAELLEMFSYFTSRTYTKASTVVDIGEVNEHMFFIESGIVREVETLPSGKRSVRWIIAENNFVYQIESFLTGEPSRVVIETIGKAQLWAIQRGDLEHLFEKFPILNHLSRRSLETHLLHQLNYLQMLRQDPEQRVLWFERHHHNLKNRVPLKDIASYLHITPETLSRVRHNWTQTGTN